MFNVSRDCSREYYMGVVRDTNYCCVANSAVLNSVVEFVMIDIDISSTIACALTLFTLRIWDIHPIIEPKLSLLLSPTAAL